MRLNYYRFPDNVSEKIKLKEGCGVILKNGNTIYVDEIPDDKRPLVDHVDDCISGTSVKNVKRLLKLYGGCGWTEHIDRDGGIFEVTDITLSGNNSRFKYNRHL